MIVLIIIHKIMHPIAIQIIPIEINVVIAEQNVGTGLQAGIHCCLSLLLAIFATYSPYFPSI